MARTSEPALASTVPCPRGNPRGAAARGASATPGRPGDSRVARGQAALTGGAPAPGRTGESPGGRPAAGRRLGDSSASTPLRGRRDVRLPGLPGRQHDRRPGLRLHPVHRHAEGIGRQAGLSAAHAQAQGPGAPAPADAEGTSQELVNPVAAAAPERPGGRWPPPPPGSRPPRRRRGWGARRRGADRRGPGPSAAPCQAAVGRGARRTQHGHRCRAEGEEAEQGGPRSACRPHGVWFSSNPPRATRARLRPMLSRARSSTRRPAPRPGNSAATRTKPGRKSTRGRTSTARSQPTSCPATARPRRPGPARAPAAPPSAPAPSLPACPRGRPAFRPPGWPDPVPTCLHRWRASTS